MDNKKTSLKLAIIFLLSGILIFGINYIFVLKTDYYGFDIYLVYYGMAGVIVLLGFFFLYQYIKLRSIEKGAIRYYERCKEQGVTQIIPDAVKKVLIETANAEKIPSDISLADYYRIGRRALRETAGTLDDENITSIKQAIADRDANQGDGWTQVDEAVQPYSSDTEILKATNVHGANRK